MHLLQIGYLTLCMTAPLEPKLLNFVIVRLIESILLPPEVYCVHKFLGLLIILPAYSSESVQNVTVVRRRLTISRGTNVLRLRVCMILAWHQH